MKTLHKYEKIFLGLIATICITCAFLLALFLGGCSHSIDGYTCKCDCTATSSHFECNGKERLIHLKGASR